MDWVNILIISIFVCMALWPQITGLYNHLCDIIPRGCRDLMAEYEAYRAEQEKLQKVDPSTVTHTEPIIYRHGNTVGVITEQGNWTLGTNDLASSSYKLWINGEVYEMKIPKEEEDLYE